MIVESAIQSADSISSVSQNGSSRESAQPAEVFEALLAMAQSGFGAQVSTISNSLHHDNALFAEGAANAHEGRLQTMADRADVADAQDRRTSGQSDSSSSRSQRLALMEQNLRQEDAAQAKDTPSRLGGRQDGPAGQAVKSRGDDLLSPLTAGREQRPSDSTQLREVPQNNPTEQGRSQSPGAPSLEPGTGRPVESAPVHAVGVTTHPVNKTGQEPSSSQAADRIGKILASGRSTGAETARALVGSEKAGLGRSGDQRPSSASPRKQLAQGKRTEDSSTPHRSLRGGQSSQRSEFNELVRSLRLNVGRGGSTARIHLKPAELGHIQIDAKLEGKTLQVSVKTETPAAYDLLRSRIADLQSSLEQHGVKLDRFELLPPDSPDQQGTSFADSSTRGSDADPFNQRDHQGRERPEREQRETSTGTGGPAPVEQDPSSSDEFAAAEKRLDLRA